MEISNSDGTNTTFLIDEMVAKALDAGPSTTAEFLSALPGIHPSDAMAAVRRLVSAGITEFPVYFQDVAPVRQALLPRDTGIQRPILPVPHPLDYEWRFSTKTIEYLLKKGQELTQNDEIIVLLGAPSLLHAGLEREYLRHLILVDSNPALAGQFADQANVISCDLLTGTLPDVTAAAVLADPPWYEHHIHAFLWTASRICQIGGHILISLPPLGTRPGIDHERNRLMDWARCLGLELGSVLPAALTYLSPPFEINALKAEGLTGVPDEWRRGDLFIFTLCQRRSVLKPALTNSEGHWREVIISGVRIRVLFSDVRTFRDPRLISVIRGDVLPSVSRRDERRSLAAVWTSGNRIFGCDGTPIFFRVLKAFATNISPETAIASFLRRDLTFDEQTLVLETSVQIAELVKTERKEYADPIE